MKLKLWTISCGLILVLMASLCAAQAPAEKKAPASKTATAKHTAATGLQDQLFANEKAAWESFKKQDPEAFKKLIATDGWDIEDHGPVTLQELANSMKNYNLTEYALDEMKMFRINPDTALVLYKATTKTTYQGKPLASPVYAATVWASRGGKWLAVFHQETPAAKQ